LNNVTKCDNTLFFFRRKTLSTAQAEEQIMMVTGIKSAEENI
jgi:hypothetical protein